MNNIITVLGGNGYIGKRCIEKLLKHNQNLKINAICRTGKIDSSNYKFDNRVNVIKGDCLNPQSFLDAIKESTGIIHTIGTLISTDANKYDQLNRQTCIRVAEIANDNKHNTNFVYISAERGLPFPLSLKFSPYLETKRKCENELLNVYTNLNSIILRPGFVMDKKDRIWSVPLYYGVNISNFIEENVLNKISNRVGECLQLPAHGIQLDTLAEFAALGALGKLEGKKVYDNSSMIKSKL
jgi:nucleoside-diphosphate-sugar epimerase